LLDVGCSECCRCYQLTRLSDKALEPRRNCELQAPQRRVAGHPKAMGNATPEKDESPHRRVPAGIATGDDHLPLEDVERLVLRMMSVWRRRGEPAGAVHSSSAKVFPVSRAPAFTVISDSTKRTIRPAPGARTYPELGCHSAMMTSSWCLAPDDTVEPGRAGC